MRYIKQGVARDGYGKIIPLATISVYLATTTTPVSIYTASSGGVAVNSITCDSSGMFIFYIDDSDYISSTLFKITISKDNYAPQTWDNVVLMTTLPIATADTLGGVKVGTGLSITDGTLSASGGSGVSKDIHQHSHGFAVGDVLYLNGTTYTKAIASAAATAEVVGMVSAVAAGTDDFTLSGGGYISGLSSLTAGTVYFLSPTSAGAITATEPTTVGQISKPVLIADSTTSGYFFNFRGMEITATGTSFASSSEAIARAEAAKAISPAVMPTDNFSNLSISASVGSKILTVALKGEDGNDPSATNKVSIKFRSATLTDSKPVTRDITGALSIALPSGATLGFTAAEAGRIYVWALDNAGTVMLGLSRTADIYQETNLHTATDIGTGSDSASVMYVTSHTDSLPVRCVGYVEITTGGTAGEWDNAPTKIQIMYNGVKRTGDVIQTTHYRNGAMATATGNNPVDNSIPQISEGSLFMTAPDFYATSAINILKVSAVGHFASSSADNVTMALFNGAADALASSHIGKTAGYETIHTVNHSMVAGTLNAISYTVRAGGGGASHTITFNGYGGTALNGGTMSSTITVTEVMA